MKPLLVYLFIINATGCVLMLTDKHRAKKNLWRISEAMLLSVALIGGSFGCLLAMYTVRHKTKHLKFSLGLPVIFAFQVFFLLLILSIYTALHRL